jgi:hypothetical protein
LRTADLVVTNFKVFREATLSVGSAGSVSLLRN